MNGVKFALNMSMVKNVMWEQGPDMTFQKIKEAGISYFEVSQADMTEEFVEQLCEASKRHLIKIIATSVNYQPLFDNTRGFDLERDIDSIISTNQKLGVNYIRDSLIPKSCIHREAGYYEAAEALNCYGKHLAEAGMKLFYHNHHFEFERFNEKTGFQILVDNTDPAYVSFEPDVHWIQRAGENPVDWIRQLSGREEMVHLKDYRICFPAGDPSPDIFEKEQCIQFAEIGEGNLDMKLIIDEAIKGGAVYLPIEQDRTYGEDPFDCIRTSVKNLKLMGYKDLL